MTTPTPTPATQHSVTITHNFETAHRLPHIGGKCHNLHGHSWWTAITVTGPVREDSTVVEFGDLKKNVRDWIDNRLDHGAMLGHADPLADDLLDLGCKVYRFGVDNPTSDEWPTVEAVATLLQAITSRLLDDDQHLRVTRVRVTETAVNEAEVTSP